PCASRMLRLSLTVSAISPPAPQSSFFPYTTLFRSVGNVHEADGIVRPSTREHLALQHFTVANEGGPNASFQRFGDSRAKRCYLRDRKSTRLNSSHVSTSYAGFCSKKKTTPAPLTAS